MVIFVFTFHTHERTVQLVLINIEIGKSERTKNTLRCIFIAIAIEVVDVDVDAVVVGVRYSFRFICYLRVSRILHIFAVRPVSIDIFCLFRCLFVELWNSYFSIFHRGFLSHLSVGASWFFTNNKLIINVFCSRRRWQRISNWLWEINKSRIGCCSLTLFKVQCLKRHRDPVFFAEHSKFLKTHSIRPNAKINA